MLYPIKRLFQKCPLASITAISSKSQYATWKFHDRASLGNASLNMSNGTFILITVLLLEFGNIHYESPLTDIVLGFHKLVGLMELK